MKKFIAISALVVLPGLAAAKSTISLYPATVNIEPVPAGEVTLQQLKFTNDTGEKATFDVFVEDYRRAGAKELEYLPLGSTNNSLEGMIEFTPAEFELEDGETQEILVRIAPSADTKYGRYQGVVFVGPTLKGEGDATVQLAGRVGALFGVVVDDPAEPISYKSPSFFRDNVAYFIVAAFIALLILGIVSVQGSGKKKSKNY